MPHCRAASLLSSRKLPVMKVSFTLVFTVRHYQTYLIACKPSRLYMPELTQARQMRLVLQQINKECLSVYRGSAVRHCQAEHADAEPAAPCSGVNSTQEIKRWP